MSLHVIQVIRELTDTGQQARRMPHVVFCRNVSNSMWEPNTDILESEDAVLIRLELAGVDPDDLCVKLKNGQLLINGERKECRPSQTVWFHQLELRYGPFCKMIPIPDNLEHNPIQACFKQGVLEIEISKKTKAIEIPITQ